MSNNYYNNSGPAGSVYLLEGSTSYPTLLSITDSLFTDNYSPQGGVFMFSDNFIVVISDCNFYYNSANYGGVLYVT